MRISQEAEAGRFFFLFPNLRLTSCKFVCDMRRKIGKDQSRRSFIRQSAMLGAGVVILPRHVLGGKRYVAPSDKLNIAAIGAGGKGKICV